MDINLRGYLVDNDTADILRWCGWRDITAPMDIAAGLAAAIQAGEDVTLLINSPGGDMTVGGEIFSMLRRHEGTTEALVQGYAASAATMAMMGAKIIQSEPGAILCYHNPSSSVSGDHRTMSAAAESLKNVRESVLNLYMTRTGKTREEIGALMDEDKWISPQQALEYGLIDKVVGLPAEEESGLPAFAAAAAPVPRVTAAMRQRYHDHVAAEAAEHEAMRDQSMAWITALAKY